MSIGLSGAYVDKQAIEELVQITASLLDKENFRGWLQLFDEGSLYELSAYSTELRQQMSWWRSDRQALEKVVDEIPRHVRDPGRNLHIVSPPLLTKSSEGMVVGESSFVVFRTSPDGETQLYVVGCYEDVFVKREQGWRYSKHKAILQTRLLSAPTHVPL